MSYGRRFYGEFVDYFNRKIEVEILKRDYSSAEYLVMKFGANPLELNYPGDDNDILHPIFGSELKINILSEVDFGYLELYSSDARGYKVKIYTESVLTWQGWLLPDLYSEPYVAPPYQVTISARCGLGELKEVQCPASLRNSITFNSFETETVFIEPLMVIFRALQTFSDIAIIDENINIMPYANDADNASPVTSTKVYLSEYDSMTWYEAIEDILRAFNARLYLADGVWRIRRIWESGTVIRKYTFSDNGTATTITVDASQSVASAKLIGKPANRYHIADSAQLDILPATKKYTIKNKFSLNDNLIENGDFSIVSDPIIRRIWVSPTLTDTEKIYPIRDGWTIVEGQRSFYDDSVLINPDDPTSPIAQPWMYLISRMISDVSVLFVENVFLGFGAPKENKYLTRIFQEIKPLNNTDDEDIFQRLRLQLKAGILTTIQENDNFSIMVKYTGYDSTSTLKTYWLKKVANYYEWDESERTIAYTIEISTGEPNNFSTIRYIDIDIMTDVLTLSNATVQIVFINSHVENNRSDATMVLSDVLSFLVATDTNDKDFRTIYRYPEETNLNFTINSNNVKIEDEIVLRTGDLPDEPNNTIIWNGGLRSPSNIATKLWHIKGEAAEYPLETLNSLSYGANKLTPQFKLSLKILSEDISFENNIVDYQVLPKEYICNAMNYDFRNCIVDGRYIEIGAWSGADWILEEGEWDNNGIWIDGETWNDSDPTP